METLSKCGRCGVGYHPHKSTSALRLTYCGLLCEIGALGFSLTALESIEFVRTPRREAVAA